MNENIVYLVGALRDGNVDNRKNKNYEIRIGQKDQRWLTTVLKPIIENSFAVKVNIYRNMLRVNNKKFVREIQKISGIRPFDWNTPKTVKKLSVNERIPYIRGFWDAEGGLPKIPELCKKAEQSYISFHQKQKEPLEFIRDTLLKLGYTPTKITQCSNAYEFRITRKQHIKKFYEEIGSWHPEKKDRLRRLVDVIS